MARLTPWTLLLRLGPSAPVLGEFGHTPYDYAVDSGQTGDQKLPLPYTSIASLTSELVPGVFDSRSHSDLLTDGSSAFGLVTWVSLPPLSSSVLSRTYIHYV